MQPRPSGTTRSLVGVLLPFMMSAYSAFSISMIVAQLARAFSTAVSTVLLAIPLDFIGGALGGVVMGYLADRYGRRPLMVASGAIFGAAVLAAAAAGNIWEIYAAWFVAGFGVNSQNGISYPVVVETLRRSTGTIGGAMQSLYFIGFLLDSLTYMYFHWWRTYLVVVGVASLILSVPPAAMIRETARRSARRAGIRSLGGRLVLYTVAFSAVVAGAFMLSVPLMGVVPTLLYGMGMGAIYVSAFSLVGFASFVLAGYLSDRLGRAASTATFAALGVVSSIALAFAGAPAYFLAALAAVYVSSGFFSFTGVWASESYPMELRATATNIVFLVGRLLGGFSPMLVIALYPSSLRVGLGMSGAISAALALAGVAIYVLAGRMRHEAPL
ncbi:MAG: MFS transporter [Conexivisphaera sp.]